MGASPSFTGAHSSDFCHLPDHRSSYARPLKTIHEAEKRARRAITRRLGLFVGSLTLTCSFKRVAEGIQELARLGLELLRLAPIPGIGVVARQLLLHILDAVQHVRASDHSCRSIENRQRNRSACLWLRDCCARLLLVIRGEIEPAGHEVSMELERSIESLVSARS